jgi:hypothetical protein
MTYIEYSDMQHMSDVFCNLQCNITKLVRVETVVKCSDCVHLRLSYAKSFLPYYCRITQKNLDGDLLDTIPGWCPLFNISDIIQENKIFMVLNDRDRILH